MRYVQYRLGGEIRPGVLHSDRLIDLKELLTAMEYPVKELPSLRFFIEAGEPAWETVREGIARVGRLTLSRRKIGTGLDEVTLDAPLLDARKLILLAGNYREHIREVGFRVPEKAESVTPQFFMKPPSTTIIGPGQAVILPRNGIWVDWEVELAVVIGKKGKYISATDAMEYVFGYTILNDISERAFNSELPNRFLREKDPFMDWLHGKWFDTFAPMGPVAVTPEEIPNPHVLQITLTRNGVVEQDANTSQMIHTIPYLIQKLSEIMTLEPGDVIATGTPSGVGHGKGHRLENGDILECKIESIGSLVNSVQAEC